METMIWRRLEPHNREDGPILKERAGMVVCGDDALCVFGGYGFDTGRHQPGAAYCIDPFDSTHSIDLIDTARSYTNELHLFHIRTCTWSSPETTGSRPRPCLGFSFANIDVSRALLFGGQLGTGDLSLERVNEVRILDMDNWHWSGAIKASSHADLWPPGRSEHSACVLLNPAPAEGSSKETHHSQSSDLSTGQHSPKLFVLCMGRWPNAIPKAFPRCLDSGCQQPNMEASNCS